MLALHARRSDQDVRRAVAHRHGRDEDGEGLRAEGPPVLASSNLYPFISFAHGIIDASYDALLTDLAAYGFVVSNMKTCAGVPVCALAPYTADQLSMLDFAEAQRAAGDALFAPTWGWRATRAAAWPRRPTRAATTGACAPRGRSTRARAP